jgi:hypothetical protein
MKHELVASVARGAVVLTMAAVFVGCGSSSPDVTPVTPAATPTPSPTLYLAPVESPSASSAAVAPESSGSPASSAASSATPAATPTAVASATPAASGSADPTFSVAAGHCTGTAKHKAFFDQAAAALSFDVYCGALSSDWWLEGGQFLQSSGGSLTASYQNVKGWTISLGEGNFCPGLPDCWQSTSSLGTASFGSLSGSLKLVSAGTYGVFVDAGTTHGYRIIGKGMTQAQFVSWAAALVKVPKS